MTILFLIALAMLSLVATVVILAAFCTSGRRSRCEPDAELEGWMRRAFAEEMS